MSAQGDYSSLDLRQMDREQARQELPMAQFERWEQLHENIKQAEQTREQWAEHDELATELVVHADVEELGTEVDLYGNELIVDFDPDNEDLLNLIKKTQRKYGEIEIETIEELEQDRMQEMALALEDIFREIILQWNGTDYRELPEDTQIQIISQARDKWGLRAFALGIVDCLIRAYEDQEQRMAAIESFHGQKGTRTN